MKVIFGKSVYLSLHTLQQLVLHHCLWHLLSSITHFIDVFLLSEGRFYPFWLKLLPRKVVQPGMSFQLFYAAFETHTSTRGSHNQFVHEVSSLGGPSWWYLWSSDDVLFGQHSISYLYSVIAWVWSLNMVKKVPCRAWAHGQWCQWHKNPPHRNAFVYIVLQEPCSQVCHWHLEVVCCPEL